MAYAASTGYAKCGTEILYAASSHSRLASSTTGPLPLLGAYTPTMQCPVLTVVSAYACATQCPVLAVVSAYACATRRPVLTVVSAYACATQYPVLTERMLLPPVPTSPTPGTAPTVPRSCPCRGSSLCPTWDDRTWIARTWDNRTRDSQTWDSQTWDS
eukprot:3297500-Rhodomonas_salina.1